MEKSQMESPKLIPPWEETARRFAPIRKLFIGLLTTWKPTLLCICVAFYCWHECLWRDRVMRFTCPLLLFALSLPILDYYTQRLADAGNRLRLLA